MPLAVPQTSLMGTVTYPFSLLLDGLDLIRREGTAPTVGVPVDSIELVEAGPGAVSSLRFTIEDPGTSATLPSPGSVVRFYDLTNNVPLFRGTVNNWQALPLGVGRSIIVDCDGPEKVLDNIVVSYTVAGLTNLQSTIQNMAGAIGLRVDNTAAGTTPEGTRATPIGQLGAGVALPYNDTGVTVTGTTFREAVRQAAAASLVHPISGAAYIPAPPNVSVDMYNGLRIWDQDAQPDDYTTLTITDTAAGARAAVRLNYEVHPGDVVHEVYIAGASGAASGWFGDGTGIVGQQAYISDATLTTLTMAQNAAQSYLLAQASTVRGSFKLDPFNPATTVHAGGLVSITDANAGLSAVTYIIQTIRKTFAAGSLALQTWEVHFGGRRPSAMQELRNLNRSVLN